MITVTKPFLPPLEEYYKYLHQIWQRQWLTNDGPLVNELELRLKDYLGVRHLLYLGNGTIAIQIAIKALNLSGEIITTPFSYIATTSSILWEGCKPVFVDINPESLNINPEKIEDSITDKTSAILATHVFGNPCDIEAIKRIADKHSLKVIYDAAHCFGTKFRGKSVFEFGDISTTSFHATKIFHTVEGGAVFTDSMELLKKMAYMRNFGHDGPEKFAEIGINGKNSEFHAVMGLCNLKHIDNLLSKRKEQSLYYDNLLQKLKIKKQLLIEKEGYNYSYYPIIFESENRALVSKRELENHEIFTRRYFYPSLSSLNFFERKQMVVSDDIAKRILCLPIYNDLTRHEQTFIAKLLLRIQNK